ncbi:prepilin peptidase [Burkholderia cenocepacia]|uniref:prepilin peptidase n=1 Tax=Burkholderia cenocepacia TaxID=95486 RepID=UPI000761E3BC|nr:A24 family peptidase [Burkholderia cenocepacia]KWU19140.1 hypothetical protein AS149_12900 [Burkholderia cenocepacia]
MLSPVFIGLLLGLLFGSYGNSLVHRLPRKMLQEWRQDAQEELGVPLDAADSTLTASRSHCPQCRSTIRWFDNLPVVSWCLLRGRCRDCRAAIPVRYIALEIAGAAIGGLTAAHFGLTFSAAVVACAGFLLLWLSAIDVEHQLLPDTLIGPLLWLGLVAAVNHLFVSPLEAVYGALAGFLLLKVPAMGFELVKGRDGLGDGDPKLMLAIGAYIGPIGIGYAMLVAALAGLLMHFAVVFLRGRQWETPLPFGQWLALGGAAVFVAQALHMVSF